MQVGGGLVAMVGGASTSDASLRGRGVAGPGATIAESAKQLGISEALDIDALKKR